MPVQGLTENIVVEALPLRGDECKLNVLRKLSG